MNEEHDTTPPMEETEFGGTSLSRQRRIIHFANGETLEEDSSDEEESVSRGEPFTATRDPAQLSWKEYSWCQWMKFGKRSLRTCDFLGEKLANLVGLNSAKYQYAIDEYHRDMTERLMHSGTDAPVAEEGAEKMQLSSQRSTEYGATSSLTAPGAWASPPSTERTTAGAHNHGYQEDEQ